MFCTALYNNLWVFLSCMLLALDVHMCHSSSLVMCAHTHLSVHVHNLYRNHGLHLLPLLTLCRYPVILSIENHCSVPQQARMAEIMKEILGDSLYDESRDESRTVLPSPDDLRRKILVKVAAFEHCMYIV